MMAADRHRSMLYEKTDSTSQVVFAALARLTCECVTYDKFRGKRPKRLMLCRVHSSHGESLTLDA